MATIIDGKAAAARLRERVAGEVAELAATGRPPGLRVVLAGEHPASAAYVRTKEKMAREAGIDAAVVRLPAEASTAEILEVVQGLNRDPEVDGILVQLPLPAGVDEQAIVLAIDPAKDVDGFHPWNVGRLGSLTGDLPPDLLVPCTPMGCLLLLEQTLGREALAGRRAVVVGRSAIVGKPLAQLLLRRHCTVTIAHSRTRDLAEECRRAEILVAAVGRPGLIRGDWVAEGAVVVDVGINRIATEDGRGRLVGDVAYAEVEPRAAAITPVPGGVGPMTVACLLANTVLAARARRAAARER
jgi:methylenetetrahydrofolate dehydrogenase (NADP+)/methenyltetrahydrofolate cyclohydrolase